GTRGEQNDISIDTPVVERDARDTAGRALDRRDFRMLMQLAASSDERRAQRAHQLAVLDLMIARAIDCGGKIGMEIRLALARLSARQPFERDAMRALEVIGVAKLRRVVAIERDHQRAFLAQLDALARGGFELGRETRPRVLAGAAEAMQSELAGLGLEAGREHAGRGPARAPSRLAALENRDRAARLREPPADRQADHAAANDRGLRCRT